MGEYWDQMPEAHFDIDIKGRNYLISIDELLMNQLSEIANSQQVSVEVLIDSWIKEKILEAG